MPARARAGQRLQTAPPAGTAWCKLSVLRTWVSSRVSPALLWLICKGRQLANYTNRPAVYNYFKKTDTQQARKNALLPHPCNVAHERARERRDVSSCPRHTLLPSLQTHPATHLCVVVDERARERRDGALQFLAAEARLEAVILQWGAAREHTICNESNTHRRLLRQGDRGCWGPPTALSGCACSRQREQRQRAMRACPLRARGCPHRAPWPPEPLLPPLPCRCCRLVQVSARWLLVRTRRTRVAQID